MFEAVDRAEHDHRTDRQHHGDQQRRREQGADQAGVALGGRQVPGDRVRRAGVGLVAVTEVGGEIHLARLVAADPGWVLRAHRHPGPATTRLRSSPYGWPARASRTRP